MENNIKKDLGDVLGVCCVCNAIRINDERNSWLDKKDDSEIYDKVFNKYEKRHSHTYCPECSEIIPLIDGEVFEKFAGQMETFNTTYKR
ncbi:MAG: hypothetical protein KKA64_04025 [Nanoarchaeota archaeon]|nr:hypothetical protein [Nanoarchaeota archaeon]